MDIAFLEIGCAGFPYFCVRVQTFYLRPYRLTYTLALYADFHKKKIKMIMLSLLIYYDNSTTNNIIIEYSNITYRPVGAERTVNICFREYLHISLTVLSFCSKLKGSLHFFFVFSKLTTVNRS